MPLIPPGPLEPRDNIELLPAARVHAELLSGLHRICFAEPWNAVAFFDLLAMPGTAGLIAVADHSLIPAGDGLTGPAGLVLWRQICDEAEILTLAVLPPWRRRHIGGRLLRAAMEATAATRAHTMFLEVASGNTSALSLYESIGFTRIGLRKRYYGSSDAITMRCDLGASDFNSLSTAPEADQ
jgi:ribosomal-protein-alanine N-acetyltransferase